LSCKALRSSLRRVGSSDSLWTTLKNNVTIDYARERRLLSSQVWQSAEGAIKLRKHFGTCLLSCSLLAALPFEGFAQSNSDPSKASPQQAPAQRDGQHDFDFNIGVWKTHIKRVLDPLAGGKDSIELNGTINVSKVWDGRAQLEEIEADGPKGHWEGMTLFLYNPQSHQWSQTFADSKTGVLNSPTTGRFENGRVELYSQDTFKDRSILVRAAWSDITPNSHHYEESYSDDGGKTWAPVLVANLTREKQ
jgi:hypothetical protein